MRITGRKRRAQGMDFLTILWCNCHQRQLTHFFFLQHIHLSMISWTEITSTVQASDQADHLVTEPQCKLVTKRGQALYQQHEPRHAISSLWFLRLFFPCLFSMLKLLFCYFTSSSLIQTISPSATMNYRSLCICLFQ